MPFLDTNSFNECEVFSIDQPTERDLSILFTYRHSTTKELINILNYRVTAHIENINKEPTVRKHDPIHGKLSIQLDRKYFNLSKFKNTTKIITIAFFLDETIETIFKGTIKFY